MALSQPQRREFVRLVGAGRTLDNIAALLGVPVDAQLQRGFDYVSRMLRGARREGYTMPVTLPTARRAPGRGPCRCGSSDFVDRPHGLTCTYCRRIR